ncbi:SCF ubiquitin ligase complex subunit cdc4 [Nowakowskiella sp. JEL0078]|nr:SCF ubiquitin ligase complex subunit cdc4 [Nowakowskiella sp. JEL0078]
MSGRRTAPTTPPPNSLPLRPPSPSFQTSNSISINSSFPPFSSYQQQPDVSFSPSLPQNPPRNLFATIFSTTPHSETTTIVTTTTTTRTEYPPLYIENPAKNLDPAIYPLAEIETPPTLKEFSIEIGGVRSSIREKDYRDEDKKLSQHHQTHLIGHQIPSHQKRKRQAPEESDLESLDVPTHNLTSRSHKRRASVVSPLLTHVKLSNPISTSDLDLDSEAMTGSRSPDLPSPRMSPTQPNAQIVQIPQHRQTTVEEITKIVPLFDALPEQLKSYMLLQLLRRSTFPTLQFVASLILPNLKKNFLTLLPLEISYTILQWVDIRSLGRCACVCKAWNAVVDGPDAQGGVWRRRLVKEGWYNEIEVERLKMKHTIANEAFTEAEYEAAMLKAKQKIYKKLFRRHAITRKNWNEGNFKSIEFPGHDQFVVTCLQFDTKKIVSGSDDHSINIWDTKSGKLRRCLTGHEGGVWALQYWGNVLVSGSTDRTVRVWDMKTGECSHVFEGHTSTVRCMMLVIPSKNEMGQMEPRWPLIVTGSRDTTLRVWRIPDPESDPSEYITATGCSSGIRKGRKRGVAPIVYRSSHENPYFVHTLTGHTQSVRAIAGAGNVLVSGSYDNSVRIWDLKEGVSKFVCTGHREKVYSVGYCEKTKIAVSGSMDASVRVWDATTGSILHVLEGHTMLVGLLELSPEYLVSAAADTKLRVWSPSTGTCLAELSGHAHAITCFHHDPKLNRIVSGSEQGIKLWELTSSGTFPLNSANVNSEERNRPNYVQGPNGIQPVHGRFIRDLVVDTLHVWRVRMDERRLVCAVQKPPQPGEDEGSTCFEVLDFGYGVDSDDESDDDEWLYDNYDGDEDGDEGDDDDVDVEGRPADEVMLDDEDDDEEYIDEEDVSMIVQSGSELGQRNSVVPDFLTKFGEPSRPNHIHSNCEHSEFFTNTESRSSTFGPPAIPRITIRNPVARQLDPATGSSFLIHPSSSSNRNVSRLRSATTATIASSFSHSQASSSSVHGDEFEDLMKGYRKSKTKGWNQWTKDVGISEYLRPTEEADSVACGSGFADEVIARYDEVDSMENEPDEENSGWVGRIASVVSSAASVFGPNSRRHAEAVATQSGGLNEGSTQFEAEENQEDESDEEFKLEASFKDDDLR